VKSSQGGGTKDTWVLERDHFEMPELQSEASQEQEEVAC
jgi:uncharacterized circularly permuted ATP-grasp superfamily protein